MRARRRIVFPRVWPARAVASRTLPVTLQPDTETGARGIDRAPLAGGYSASRAGSHVVIDHDAISPGRSFIGGAQTADNDLNLGPAPNRIDRGTTAREAGKIGVGAGPDGIAGWPYDANEAMLPHINIPRTPITVSPFARTIDTGVTIPSVSIGEPVS